MKPRSLLAPSTALALMAIGLSAPARAAEPAATQGPFEFRLPADAAINEGMGCGVFAGFDRRINNIEGSKYAAFATNAQDPGLGSLTLFEGAIDQSVGKGVKFPATYRKSVSGGACTVRVELGAGEPFRRGGLLNVWKVQMTPLQVVQDSVRFIYTVEVPSNYPADATMANFDRLAAKDCDNVGLPVSQRFPSNLDRGGARYCIAVNGRQHDTGVKCLPYRNGSICKVTTSLTTQPQGSIWDLTKPGADFKSAVKAIVGN